MPLIIGLYLTDLYTTNYWIVCDGFVRHQLLIVCDGFFMLLIIGLYVMDLYAPKYWILYDVFVCQ